MKMKMTSITTHDIGNNNINVDMNINKKQKKTLS